MKCFLIRLWVSLVAAIVLVFLGELTAPMLTAAAHAAFGPSLGPWFDHYVCAGVMVLLGLVFGFTRKYDLNWTPTLPPVGPFIAPEGVRSLEGDES